MTALLAVLFYVGCSTGVVHTNGLHIVELEEASGTIRLVSSQSADNAIYLAREKDVLYAAWGDGLRSFRCLDAELKPIDALRLETRCLCHVALVSNGVVWADYADGQAGYVTTRDGNFKTITRYRHRGRGSNLPRQDGAHCHQALPTPDGRRFVVTDLGLDTLTVYPIDPQVARTSTLPFPTFPRGAGPRHIVFHPNGRYAFVLFELGNLLSVYEWNNDSGFGHLLDQRPTIDPWPSGRPYDGDLAAAIRMSPDGRFVIVSNRGEQSLVAFAFDEASQRLILKSRSALPGSWPRDFLFVSPTRALVTMERTGEVHSLAYDPQAGTFRVLHTLSGLFHPVALAL